MQKLTQAILSWHEITARDLPWRGERDPYRIYVSEIMLQQTRTAAVARYYAPFLAAFPDPQALAEADIDQVYKKWEGLGYYARARNLHAAMKMVAGPLGGRFPDTREALLALPGCGSYVSGAVASIAFGRRELALDGNGVRVLSRVSGESRDSTVPETRRALEEFGRSLLPETGAGDFNQALMGMGNLVCLPRKTLCDECPAAPWCRGRLEGNALSLPVKPAREEKKIERRLVAVITDGKRTLARKRSESLLKGLYEFVNLPWPEGMAPEAVLRARGFPAENLRALGPHEHVFTHRIWRMEGFLVWSEPVCRDDFVAMTTDELAQAAMPSAMAPYRRAAEEAMK